MPPGTTGFRAGTLGPRPSPPTTGGRKFRPCHRPRRGPVSWAWPLSESTSTGSGGMSAPLTTASATLGWGPPGRPLRRCPLCCDLGLSPHPPRAARGRRWSARPPPGRSPTRAGRRKPFGGPGKILARRARSRRRPWPRYLRTTRWRSRSRKMTREPRQARPSAS